MNPEKLAELAERVEDFNTRLSNIIENDGMSVEGKNLAIGLLVTLRAPMLRQVPSALRSRMKVGG